MCHKAVNEYRTILFSRLEERKQLTFKLLTLCKILEAHWLIGERLLDYYAQSLSINGFSQNNHFMNFSQKSNMLLVFWKIQ